MLLSFSSCPGLSHIERAHWHSCWAAQHTALLARRTGQEHSPMAATHGNMRGAVSQSGGGWFSDTANQPFKCAEPACSAGWQYGQYALPRQTAVGEWFPAGTQRTARRKPNGVFEAFCPSHIEAGRRRSPGDSRVAISPAARQAAATPAAASPGAGGASAGSGGAQSANLPAAEQHGDFRFVRARGGVPAGSTQATRDHNKSLLQGIFPNQTPIPKTMDGEPDRSPRPPRRTQRHEIMPNVEANTIVSAMIGRFRAKVPMPTAAGGLEPVRAAGDVANMSAEAATALALRRVEHAFGDHGPSIPLGSAPHRARRHKQQGLPWTKKTQEKALEEFYVNGRFVPLAPEVRAVERYSVCGMEARTLSPLLLVFRRSLCGQ